MFGFYFIFYFQHFSKKDNIKNIKLLKNRTSSLGKHTSCPDTSSADFHIEKTCRSNAHDVCFNMSVSLQRP